MDMKLFDKELRKLSSEEKILLIRHQRQVIRELEDNNLEKWEIIEMLMTEIRELSDRDDD